MRWTKGGVEDVGLHQDTIGDEVLGTAGAFAPGLLAPWWRRRESSVNPVGATR